MVPVILIVDDVVENIRILKNLLQDVGQVIFARDGVEALAQVERHHPHIVLLDVVMPGMDGVETCRRLKSQPHTRDIPVIFITSAIGEEEEATGLATGAIDYITKPFAPALVRARVQNHLALMQAHAELRRVNEALRKYKAAVDGSSAAIMITDRAARIEYVNPAFVAMSGFTAEEAIGETPALLKSPDVPAESFQDLWNTVLAGGHWRGELRNRRKDGAVFWQDVAIAPVYDGGAAITHFVAINSDITERKRMEEELHRLAITDALTGVANRRRLLDVGEYELARARRTGSAVCALMLDIDHFKQINDTLGHSAGDAVLQAFTALCMDSVRSIDTVGRLGGEEFVVVLPLCDEAGALQLAERLRERVAASEVEWDGLPVQFTVSVGVAQHTGAAAGDFVALLAAADRALYRAKHAGRNRVATASSNTAGNVA